MRSLGWKDNEYNRGARERTPNFSVLDFLIDAARVRISDQLRLGAAGSAAACSGAAVGAGVGAGGAAGVGAGVVVVVVVVDCAGWLSLGFLSFMHGSARKFDAMTYIYPKFNRHRGNRSQHRQDATLLRPKKGR